MLTRFFYIASIAVALLLTACGNSGGSTQVNAGNSGALSLPFAVTTLPNPGDLKATLQCPDGTSVDMKLNAADSTVLGSCDNLAAGSNETFTVVFAYGSGNTILATASKNFDVVGGQSQSLSFSASDYTRPDDDGDGFTNLYEIANGMDPLLLNYKIGVTVSGLKGSLVLDNGGDQLSFAGDGTSSFAVAPVDQASYSVAIVTPPAGQECTLGNNSSGTINGGSVDITVSCVSVYKIGGSVVGLAGSGLVLQDTLQDNSTDPLAIDTDKQFTFTTPVPEGGSYNVTVLTQPASPSQTCIFGGSDPSSVSGINIVADVNNVNVTCTTNTFTVGGQVDGLLGTGLVLQNVVSGSTTDSYSVNGTGSFTFGTAITDLGSYSVSVSAQPTNPAQICNVDSGATGQLNGANINNVHVACVNVYTISGTISGLSGSGLVLRNGAGESLNISNGSSSFAFSTQYFDGDTYAVSVATNPKALSQTCTVVANATATVSKSDVTNIQVTCATNTYTIGGTVSGLAAGNSIVLQDNGADNITMASNGNFTFATPIADGDLYNVTFLSAPTDQPCTSTYGAGKLNGAKVNHVNVFCGPKSFWHVTTGNPAVAREFNTMTVMADGRVLVTGGYNGTVLNSVELFDPADETWKNMTPMNSPRMHHTATLLANGNVLVTGGMDGTSVVLNSAEVFDLASNTWTTLANPMATPREYHSATLLPSGKVLVAGGTDGTVQLASSELYDPVGKTWAATGNTLTVARSQHTATLLGSGNVLVVGGTDGAVQLASAELYDAVADSWSSAGTMSAPRDLHTATLLPNGKVLVAGGYNSPNSLSSAELYDPANPASPWSAAKAMAGAHSNHTATLLANGKVLIAGSSDSLGNAVATSEIYDPTADSWSAATDMNTARGWATAVLLRSGSVLVVGGSNAAVTGNYLASSEVYANHAWTISGDMNVARKSHRALLLGNGDVMVAAGDGNNGIESSAEIYSATSNTWGLATDSQAARVNHSMTMLDNGLVLVAGGSDSVTGYLPTAARYDAATDTWTPTLNNMTIPRALHTATLLNDGRVLVTGGATKSGPFDASAEIYDPSADDWTPTASMKYARVVHTATLLTDGRVLVVGGGVSGTYLASAEIYDPVTESWSDASSLKRARSYHTATLMPDGRVLVVGGVGSSVGQVGTAEIYDPSLNTWSDAGTLLTPRDYHAATLLASGKVLVTGGYNNQKGGELGTAEVYDPATNQWSAAGSMITTLTGFPSSRDEHTATRLSDGRVLVVGGYGMADNAGALVTGILTSSELY